MRPSTSLPPAMHLVWPPRPWCAPSLFLFPQKTAGAHMVPKKTLNIQGFSFFSMIPAQPLIQSCGVS